MSRCEAEWRRIGIDDKKNEYVVVAIRHVKIEGMEENDMVIRDEFAGDLTNEAIVYNEEDVVDDNDAMNQPDVYFHKSMRTCANMQTEDVIV